MPDPKSSLGGQGDAKKKAGGEKVAPPQGQNLPEPSPDFVEEEFSEQIDNIIPTRGYDMTPMIGIGGSAGSIPALQTFFENMSGDSGLVFVVVMHLSPTHASNMAAMISRWTKMSVVQAEDRQKVEPNTVYVIPPGKHLTAVNGHLRLTDLEPERGKRVAVDLFFRSLADTHGPHSAAVVLSGADGDGAIGLRRIKERGGLTIVQEPDEAEYRGMPQASIDTGMVDWVLSVSEMPARVLNYFHREKALKLPPEDGPQPARPVTPPPDQSEAALRDVLSYLRTRTGRDFSYYKRATIVRRISRRMQVNDVQDVPAYLAFLRSHPGEAGALLQDLLISVTNFFRDREAFEALAQHIPELFKGRDAGESIRVWVPACATGEEAYSIAMLLLEEARRHENPPILQVFACDLDDGAIQRARAGIYPEASAADVSEERLRRFFVKEHAGYRVRHELREMVLFAAHDLLKDAPFSRMDLVSCRNLLIYLNREAQARVLDIFHFALKPNGRLFLGSSESVDDDISLFRVLDKKHRIYQQLPAQRTGLPVPEGPSTLLRALVAQEPGKPAAVVHGRAFVPEGTVPFHHTHAPTEPRGSLAELHFKLLERIGPPSILVNAEHEIVHLSENAGRLLAFPGGEPSTNLLRALHPMLRIEVRAAIFRAVESGAVVEVFGLPLEMDGVSGAIDLRVAPANEIAPGYLLLTFEKRAAAAARAPESSEAPPAETSAPESVVRHLERELEHVKGHLRDTVEQYEASTEELKASNEELQAMNEELRSASEELETSREELQSINEELNTVNQELKGKIDEIAHTNSDLQNLMASTAIATVFLDRAFHVMRYTPSAVEIFHLIPGDVGRPLSHLKHTLDYPQLLADAESVLRTLVPIEREVRADGHWYQARLQPYRTLDDQIAGVVLTLVDVTEQRRANEELLRSEERFRLVIASARDYAIFMTDAQRRITDWSPGAKAVFGYGEEEIRGQPTDILFTPEDREKGDVEREIEAARQHGIVETARWHVRKDGSLFFGSGSVRPLHDAPGNLCGFLKILRDQTDARHAHEDLENRVGQRTAQLQASNAELRTLPRRVIAAQEAERAHLSRELHDQIGQQLTGLNMLLHRATEGTASQAKKNAEEAAKAVAELLQQVRKLSVDLRPPALDDLGLRAALEAHIREFSARTGVEMKFSAEAFDEARISPECKTTAFRIAQESLTNVARHAKTKTAIVTLRSEGEMLFLEIADTGKGFNPDDPRTTVGLSGMRERVTLMQGKFQVTSAPGQGTRIRVELPSCDELKAPGA